MVGAAAACLRPLRLGKPLKHRQALVAGTTLDNVRAMAVTKQVPHLQWSQAPPLPWPRPGSADIYIYIFNWNGPQYTTNSTNMICVCPQWGIPQKGESNGGQGWSTIQMDTSTQRGHFERIKSVKKKLGLNQHGL